MLKPGDKVTMNGKYWVFGNERKKVFTVCSEPFKSCGSMFANLEGVTGGYPCDGLDLVEEKAEMKEEEQIESLRTIADMLDSSENAGNLVIPAILRNLRTAADTIESMKTELTKQGVEISNLLGELVQVSEERNSALKDMNYLRDGNDKCFVCVHDTLNGDRNACDDCNYQNKYQWRGIRK